MNKGLPCPICKTGHVTLIPETLKEDEPKNRCNNCGAIFTFIIEDDGTDVYNYDNVSNPTDDTRCG